MTDKDLNKITGGVKGGPDALHTYSGAPDKSPQSPPTGAHERFEEAAKEVECAYGVGFNTIIPMKCVEKARDALAEKDAAIAEMKFPPKDPNAKAFVKRTTQCVHNEYWTTLSGDCMACRVEVAETALKAEHARGVAEVVAFIDLMNGEMGGIGIVKQAVHDQFDGKGK